MEQLVALAQVGSREPWNKGKLVGQKAPLRLKEIWAIRIRLQLSERTRELALFNLAVDSKLRSCDLVTLLVRDITHGERIAARAIVMQQKTQRPVQSSLSRHEILLPHGSEPDIMDYYFAASRWMGSIQYTSSTRSAASMLRLTTTDSLSLRTNTHSSGVSLERLISWCGT
jgi:hypothetical protein